MNKTRITSLILAITFISLFIPTYSTMSQEEIKRPTAPEKECEEQKPKIFEKDIKKVNIMNFESIMKMKSDADDEYNKYVECIFNYSEKRILGNVGLSNGTVQGNTPNIDWMDPKASCLSFDKLKTITDDTAPNQLLAPLLETQAAYADYLDKLVDLYKYYGRENTSGSELIASSGLYSKIKLQVDLEKERSLVAMNMAFIELKELRLSFIMHVEFQCMLNNLEKYRKLLGDIRTLVEGLPSKLEDASMTK